LPLGPGGVDRTAKMYIGGRQARPDGGYSRAVLTPGGKSVGEVGEGNRKDIRNAVEAARKAAPGWGRTSEHNRAQILYYVAENMDARAAEFTDRLRLLTGSTRQRAHKEIRSAVERLFAFAALADKYEGVVHKPPFRGLALAMNEPIGVVGVVCPEAPGFLPFVSLLGAALAGGNAVVVVPSETMALMATDFYQVLETSDVPGGVINIVTGARDALGAELARHDAVDAIWYFGGASGAAELEAHSIGNLKQTWAETLERDWFDPLEAGGRDLLRRATQVKNIWIPYGE